MNDEHKLLRDSESARELWLDRVADGEVSREELARGLRELDHIQNGWKQLATRLLEARAMRTAFAHLLAEKRAAKSASKDSLRPAVSEGGSGAMSWRKTIGSILALAACAFLSFGLGRVSLPNAVAPSNQVAVVEKDGSKEFDELVVIDPQEGSSREGRARPLGAVNLVVHPRSSSGPAFEVGVPIYEQPSFVPEIRESTGANWGETISEQSLSDLRKKGRDLIRTRSVYTMPLDDGRVLHVPVESMKVVPITVTTF